MTDLDSKLEIQTRQWIESQLRQKGIDATNFARERGLNQSTITRFLNGDTHKLSPKTLNVLAEHAAVALPAVVRAALDARSDLNKTRIVNIQPPNETELPIWGIHPRQRDGEFFVNPHPITTSKRPFVRGASRKLIAFYAPDETMSPRWRRGEPVLVDLMRPASVGHFALVVIKNTEDENGPELYLFRQTLGRSGGFLRLAMLSDPEEVINIPIVNVLDEHKIIEWEDLLP